MNLWLRLLWLFLTRRSRPRLAPPLGVSVVSLMVFPGDLDVYGHVNNGRYLTIMDLGRMDLFLRGGLVSAIRGAGWTPVLSAAAVRFQRELRVWQKFRLETRIVYWEQTAFVMEHRIILPGEGGRERVATRALMRGGLYDRGKRAFVRVDDLFKKMGVDMVSPAASADVRAFLDADEAMKQAV